MDEWKYAKKIRNKKWNASATQEVRGQLREDKMKENMSRCWRGATKNGKSIN